MRRTIMFIAFAVSMICVPNALAAAPQLATGGGHTCAVSDAGALRCWGNNAAGQLGTGNTAPSLTPVDVPGFDSGVVAVGAESNSTCASLSSGKTYCWGSNVFGELGDNTNDALPHPTPTEVPGLTGVTAIGGGYLNFCALINDGSVKCWGTNAYHQIGNASASNPQKTPIAVQGLTGATQIAVGEAHNCALQSDGVEKCWGYYFGGGLGNGPSVTDSITAQPVLNISGVTAMFNGSYTGCALVAAGAAKCWGSNTAQQVGVNGGGPYLTPVDVAGISGGIAMGGAVQTNCALLASGQLKCWGTMLGNGTNATSFSPVDVTDGADIVAVSQNSFGSHICMIHRGGRVSCWGSNDTGQLGNGASGVGLEASAPVGVTGLDLITAQAAPISPTFAIVGKPKVDRKHKNYSVTAALKFSVPATLAPLEACSGAFVTTTSYRYTSTKRVKGKLKKVKKTKILKTSPQLSSTGNDCVAAVGLKLPVKYFNHKKIVLTGAFAGNTSLTALTIVTPRYSLAKVKPLKKK